MRGTHTDTINQGTCLTNILSYKCTIVAAKQIQANATLLGSRWSNWLTAQSIHSCRSTSNRKPSTIFYNF